MTSGTLLFHVTDNSNSSPSPSHNNPNPGSQDNTRDTGREKPGGNASAGADRSGSARPPFHYQVLIAGGGFAGVYCARALASELGGESRSRVAVVADQNFMVFQPMLAEVAGSSLSPQHVVNPIRRICRGVTVLRGTIQSIDLPKRQLTLNAGNFTRDVTLGFEHLVLALGGIVDLSRVPGMPEHALLMKTVGDAQELRGMVIDRIEEANLQLDPSVKRRLLTFVVVGGGYSGVETAGQIHDLIRDVNRFYPRIAQPDFRVVLIHSGAHLLPEIGEKLGAYCGANLSARGIEVILNSRVTSMTASRVKLQDGRTIETHTVVSTVGNAPNPLLTELCRQNNFACFKGRVMTEGTLRVIGQENVWAAGDCAAVPMDEAGKKEEDGPVGSPVDQRTFCPPTAQFAYRQGELLGRNLAAVIDFRPEALEPFTFTGLGELASIGHRRAVADIFGLKFSGLFAWFMWRAIYLSKLPGLERKLRVLLEWTLDLFFPRDLTLLQTRPTEVVQEMHLEKGDEVFHAGEPALSFYIVKTGRIDLLDEHGVVKTLTAGEHFGERALLHDKIWRFTAVATERSMLVALSARVFETISKASSSMHSFFEHSANQYLTREQVQGLVNTMAPEMHGFRVEEVMSKEPVSLHREHTIAEALKLVVKHPFNSFPLTDASGRAFGVISQNQIYDALKNGHVTPESTLEKLVPINLPTVLPGTPIPEAVERFLRSGRHKLLVVDESARLMGILTPVDLLARQPNEIENRHRSETGAVAPAVSHAPAPAQAQAPVAEPPLSLKSPTPPSKTAGEATAKPVRSRKRRKPV